MAKKQVDPNTIDWTELDSLTHAYQEALKSVSQIAAVRRDEIQKLHGFGVPFKAIADHLGITPEGLYASLSRARRKN